MMKLNVRQARQFLLRHHGLLGKHVYNGKDGILSFIRHVGCIQYDPVDICGRNADIVLNSRVKSYKKEMLAELLYKDRRLVDYFDKNLSIFPVEDLPVFLENTTIGGYAEAYDSRGGDTVKRIEPAIRRLIEERGHISAKEVDINETIEWHWSIPTSLPRAALESMYYRGELIIHHKTGTNKSYALMKDSIPAEILSAALPYSYEVERLAWHLLRRIGAVGMLWNKPSDALLGLGIKAAERAAAFAKLLADGDIFEIAVDGLKDHLYVHENERAALEEVLSEKAFPHRVEFIAPLDNLIWDRKLIAALFGFDYKWEIYTPKEKRKFSAYTLPVLCGDSFIGRVEVVRKESQLVIKNIWSENGKPLEGKVKTAFEKCADQLAGLNECGDGTVYDPAN